VNNLDLKAAAARVDVAAGLVVQARSLLYPYVNIVGGVGATGRDDVRDKSGIGGQVLWELDLWGRVRAQAAEASAVEAAAAADLAYARQSLAATTSKLWYQAISVALLQQNAARTITVYEELARLVGVRFDVGQSSRQEVAMAEADLFRIRRQERQLVSAQQQVVRGLETLVGRYPAAELQLAGDIAALPGPVPEGLPAELLERRPDLVAAERRVAAAFYGIQVATAARLPAVAITAAGGRSTNEIFKLVGVSPNFWQVGLGFLAPLFTGGALAAAVDTATAEQQTAVALYGRTVLAAFQEVETVLENETLLSEQEEFLQTALARDQEAVRLGRVRFDVGQIDLLSVLQLQARQYDTEYDLITLRNDRLSNRIALHLALGGGFRPYP
jgi:NodT family efflux transporter outer membrane factor (OMF) lipoprotein